MSKRWFAPTARLEYLPAPAYDDGTLAMTVLHTDLPNDAQPPQEPPRDTDSLSDLDARLNALAEQTARLTAAVKGRARDGCCPRCGYYFTMEREEKTTHG